MDKNRSRIRSLLTLAALFACGRAAAGEDAALGAAFDSAQKTIQAAAAPKRGVFVTPAVGAWVMDRENRVGQVVEVHPNGTATYRVGDELRISNDLAAEIPEGNGFRTGDTVMDRGFDIGTQARIFEGVIYDKKGRRNGPRVYYKVGDRWYVDRPYNLSRSVSEYRMSRFSDVRLRPGSTILTTDGRTLTAELVFSDGRVSVARAGAKPEILGPDGYKVIEEPGSRAGVGR